MNSRHIASEPVCSAGRGGRGGRGGRDEPGHDVGAGPRRQRSESRLSLAVARMGGTTRVAHLAEAGSARLRLPRSDGSPLEAVTINTGGGIVGGDRFATEIAVGPGARLVVTSAAAEKIYRSEGGVSELAATLRVEAGACLAWLPQETILYDRARLRRSLTVDLHPDATAFLFEATVFGRAAFGETVREGAYEDRWRIRRGGRLVYADTLRLAGDIAAQLAKPGVAAGQRALATALYVAPDAEVRLDAAREALAGAAGECGASAWNGLLAVRFLAADIRTLRRDAADFMLRFRGRALPRMWHL